MAEQQASGYSVQVQGIDSCLRVLTKAGAQLHDLDQSQVRLANSTLRAEAKNLADTFGREVVAPLVADHGGPQGPKMADTIRPKADRIPIVRIGAVNPKLSGFKSRRGRSKNTGRAKSNSAGYKGSLAWGAEFGPHPANNRNPYGRPRSGKGYILGPRMDRLQRELVPHYIPMLEAAMATAGWPVADRRAA